MLIIIIIMALHNLNFLCHLIQMPPTADLWVHTYSYCLLYCQSQTTHDILIKTHTQTVATTTRTTTLSSSSSSSSALSSSALAWAPFLRCVNFNSMNLHRNVMQHFLARVWQVMWTKLMSMDLDVDVDLNVSV